MPNFDPSRVRMRRPALLAAAIGLALTATGALAQAPDANGRLIYEAAFFVRFSPANALEIVQRVPGFTLDQVDEEVRGFSQAAGNVVINGQRPSSKTDTLRTILARIPANRVLRVEVAPGEQFGSDYSGKAQVLNLVLTSASGLAGTLEGALRRDFTGNLLPQGSASALLKRGGSTFNASVAVINDETSEEGYDRLTGLPGGEELEFRSKVNRIEDPNAAVAASWDFDDGANRTAHLNARYAREWFSLTQSNAVFPAVGAIRDDWLTQRNRRRDFELGGDVTRPFAGGGIKLIGLATRRRRVNEDVSLNRIANDVLGGFAQILADQRDETLMRLVWTRPKLAGWTVEIGAEGVLNRLDSDVGLFEIDANDGRTRIDLPIDQAVVKEYRGEAFVNAGRSLDSRLRLDLGLTFEASRLTVTGDTDAKRPLRFLKPKATLDWRPKGKWHVQLSLQRTVAQLQFEDFISTAQLSSGQVSGGNAELVPQRAWEALATVERPILGDGLVKLEAGYNRVSLVQDRVPTPEGFDAPGNLGSGNAMIARARVDAPLVRFGVKGGRLTLYGSWFATSVEDPYTARRRPFSGNERFLFEVNFRQDLGKYAWGLNLEGNTRSTFYRREERDSSSRRMPYVSAFAEYRPNAKTTLILSADNLTGAPAFRKRTFFAPDRSAAEPYQFEYRRRNQHIVPYVTLKHSFG